MLKAELIEIIANGENSGVEFKLDAIRPEQLAKEIVALANLKGGHILLGVADDKTVVGITRSNLGEWVADMVFARYVHPLILPYYEEVVMDDGKRVAVITIGQECFKPYVVRANDREIPYVRIGSVSRPATREQLLLLGAASGVVHAEIMPVHRTSFDSLDQARLENYLRDILKDPEVPETRAAWIIRLKGLGLLTEGVTEEAVCTIAGLLLFGINPRQYLKQSGVRLIFFDSLDKIYQARLDKVLDAPLVGRFQIGKTGKSLIDAGLIEKTLELMEPFITLEPNEIDENFRRERIWLYPFEAIRELLINALAHRDWTRFTDVEIVGYRDRLEMTSPGALPNSMTIEKMLAGQRSARNNIIVEVLRDYGYVDARGMGVRTKVIPLMKQSSGKEPGFEATEDFVKTVLARIMGHEDAMSASILGRPPEISILKVQKTSEDANIDASLTDLQVQIVGLIRHTPTISYDDLVTKMGRDRSTIMRNIQKLKKIGLLIRIGSKKTGQWEVTEQ